MTKGNYTHLFLSNYNILLFFVKHFLIKTYNILERGKFMNYFNPYYMAYPTVATAPKTGLLKSLFGGINLQSILSGTSKTLNVVNQALPLVRQAGPMMRNAKTMFRVMNEFKRVDSPTSTKATKTNEIRINEKKEESKTIPPKQNGPTFFL